MLIIPSGDIKTIIQITFHCYAINIFLCVHFYSFYFILKYYTRNRPIGWLGDGHDFGYVVRSLIHNMAYLPIGKSKKFTVSKRRSAARLRP